VADGAPVEEEVYWKKKNPVVEEVLEVAPLSTSCDLRSIQPPLMRNPQRG